MSDTIPAENQIPSTIETDLIRLAKINNRFDGTGGDKTGVEIIRKAMETCGFQTRTETFSVPGFWSWRLLLVIGIFFLINFLFRYILLFSLILYLLNMVMLWGELTFSFHAADRLLFRHKSVNVEALISADKKKPKTVIVMAHHDTPRTGNIYPIAGRVVKFGSALPPPFNRFFMTSLCGRLVFWCGSRNAVVFRIDLRRFGHRDHRARLTGYHGDDHPGCRMVQAVGRRQ